MDELRYGLQRSQRQEKFPERVGDAGVRLKASGMEVIQLTPDATGADP
jgi:hypothetical protein